MKTVVLIYGLPGSGKTTLALRLHKALRCPWYNADRVRATLSSDLGFSAEDRIEQARRLACLSALTLESGQDDYVLVDFVNPTVDSYATFQHNLTASNKRSDRAKVPSSFSNQISFFKEDLTIRLYSVFMDTVKPENSRFRDTATLFDSNGRNPDYVVNKWATSEKDWEDLTENLLRDLTNKQ